MFYALLKNNLYNIWFSFPWTLRNLLLTQYCEVNQHVINNSYIYMTSLELINKYSGKHVKTCHKQLN